MTSISEMIELSKELAKAKGLLPKHAQDAGSILAIILAGQELGWGPMGALRSLQLVSGKLTLTADAMLGLVVKAGIRITWEKDGTDGVATLVMKRGDMNHRQTFTMDDAKKAGLSSDTWRKYGPAMLRARCVSAAVRAFCPDVLNGAYLPGELPDDSRQEGGSDEPAPAKPTPRTLDDVASKEQTVSTAAKHGFVVDFKQLMADLPNVPPEMLGAWFEDLQSAKPTNAQKKEAWEAFTVRCAEFEIDSKQFLKGGSK
jgi:hypothetical protein